jgi:NAD(P)-dependent dehydrogenase (short-subunit alcohol dehydrogenase family)
MSANAAVAVVTGANRGIGLEVARQLATRGHIVVLGSRDLSKGQAVADRLVQQGIEVLPRRLDVTKQDTIDALVGELSAVYGRLDILINNAAILYDTWQRASSADLRVVQEALDTNLFGAWRMCLSFLPLMRASGNGRIVNVSSGAGSITHMGGGTPAYSLSKAALNALTRMLASELQGDRILVNAVCPGWVATDMGGSGGRPVREGAASVLWAVDLPPDGPTGGFFRDGRPLLW